ncbi:GNAT family N-acetyltransferase [Vibrio sp. SCSIO 43137]|uniref:GNAT family N-acetyltransferase n=1 Tax=Vibrio sp. SCSIO 43137 TaxID=3021011 RepID=UPI0023078798|nr:GNAT family N-acetyltransferase [Vibrio sp. SCSIO 43137]WCE30827.1 GNAT family N-acetyltransferase [Vibrio sp. SCSIO 43137]
MNIAKIMHDYNLFERKELNAFNGEQVCEAELVKFVCDDTYGSYISFFSFSEQVAEQRIAQQVDYFKQRGLKFEWKTYSTDLPENMGDLLLAKGFTQEETESFMVLDLATAEERTFNEFALTEATDSKGIRDAIDVQQQVWGGDLEWQYNYLLKLKIHSPQAVSIYVVYVDGKPVTSAWLTFNGNSPFAGIWGGSTVEEYRGRGYYSLLLNKRIAEAKERGKQYLIIDASEMSRPIVEKHGFKLVAKTTGYSSPE